MIFCRAWVGYRWKGESIKGGRKGENWIFRCGVISRCIIQVALNLVLFFACRDGSSRRRGDGREMLPSRSRLGLTGLGSSQDLGSSNGDLYYNSRPEGHWSYQPPPPPVITHQPKPSSTQHFQPYERGYPKTLESLAEKVSLRDVSRADIRIFTRIEIHRKDGETSWASEMLWGEWIKDGEGKSFRFNNLHRNLKWYDKYRANWG